MPRNSVKSSVAKRAPEKDFAFSRFRLLLSERPVAMASISWFAAMLFATAFIGCGGESSSSRQSKPSTENSKSSLLSAVDKKQGNRSTETDSKFSVRIDENGRKWIDDIPYDVVFFDDPLAIAANDQPVANAGSPTTSRPKTSTGDNNTNDKSTTPKANSNAGWKRLVAIETLKTEIKRIRITLNESTKSIGNYNRQFEKIQIQGAMLAAIAAIVGEHPDSVIWKQHASQVRGLGANISAAADSRGRESYKQTRVAVEQCLSVLSGELPPDLKNTPADAELADLADLGNLMKRMKQSLQFVKDNSNDADSLKDNSDAVLHEMTLLAALAKIITSPSYDSADDEDYLRYTSDIIQAVFESADAVRNDQFDRFRDVRQRIQTKCDDCHRVYR